MRIQRKRTKGWRMPENTVYVGRGTKFGNPFYVADKPTIGGGSFFWCATNEDAVKSFCLGCLEHGGWSYPSHEEIKKELAGKNLACNCPLDQQCHADLLLDVANKKGENNMTDLFKDVEKQLDESKKENALLKERLGRTTLKIVNDNGTETEEFMDKIDCLEIEIQHLKASNKLNPPETAHLDGTVFLGKFKGYPRMVQTVWNPASIKWCYARLDTDMYEGKFNDHSFSCEYEYLDQLDGWLPMPKV